MFTYSSIPEGHLQKLANSMSINYVKVLYNDPDPILKDNKPEPCCLPDRFKSYAEAIKSFTVRNNDVWVMGHAKSGTTVVTELVSVLINDLNFEKIDRESLTKRAPLLEISGISKDFKGNSVEMADSNPNQRLMKTHLPVNLLPTHLMTMDQSKIIYVIRNPKDTAISWYHFNKNLHGFNGTLGDCLDGYLSGYVAYGSYFKHADEFIQLSKRRKNILLVTYEDLVTNPVEVVRRVAEFLEKSLSDAEVRNVAQFIHFDQMKARKNSNKQDIAEGNKDFRFMRKGVKGSHREEMPAEYIELFNAALDKWANLKALYPEY